MNTAPPLFRNTRKQGGFIHRNPTDTVLPPGVVTNKVVTQVQLAMGEGTKYNITKCRLKQLPQT